MSPPAPGRFSTTKFWWSRTDSFSATSRPSVSALPPGGNGATIFTGRAGQSCASTPGAADSAARTPAAASRVSVLPVMAARMRARLRASRRRCAARCRTRASARRPRGRCPTPSSRRTAVRRSRRNQLLIQQMPDVDLRRDAVRAREVRRPDRGREAVLGVVRQRDGLVLGVERRGRGSTARRSPRGSPRRSPAARSRSSAGSTRPSASSFGMSGMPPPVTTVAPSSTRLLVVGEHLLRGAPG